MFISTQHLGTYIKTSSDVIEKLIRQLTFSEMFKLALSDAKTFTYDWLYKTLDIVYSRKTCRKKVDVKRRLLS